MLQNRIIQLGQDTVLWRMKSYWYCRFSTSYDKYSHHHMTREIWDNVDTND
uniref:Uncharacterized protein n=1 Tax=Helianthus annuus TaxID=4232 RepID=A0A251UD80_HELAN